MQNVAKREDVPQTSMLPALKRITQLSCFWKVGVRWLQKRFDTVQPKNLLDQHHDSTSAVSALASETRILIAIALARWDRLDPAQHL